MRKKILVIGGYNADINIRPAGLPTKQNSNIAHIEISPGGVGRNISMNLSALGGDVTFLSSMADDTLGHYVEGSFREKEINFIPVQGRSTGIYVSILDKDGDMDTAFCDMRAVESLSFADISGSGIIISDYDAVVIDANLSENTIWETTEYCRETRTPFAFETVSNEKCRRLKKSLAGCMFIKPNRGEAEALTGQACRTNSEAAKCAGLLIDAGVNHIVVSMGAGGFIYSEAGFTRMFEQEGTAVKDATGAGDALFAAALLGILMGLKPDRIGEAARKSAAIACGSPEAVSANLSPDVFRI
jgi:pseudouridine kinase